MAEHSPQIVASEEEATTPHTIEQETLHVMQRETPFLWLCVSNSQHIYVRTIANAMFTTN